MVENRSLQSGVVNIFAVLDPHLQNPYSMNMYFGIQRQLTPTLVLESAFVGTRGVKFPAGARIQCGGPADGSSS